MAVEFYATSPLSHYDPNDLLDALATGIVVLDAQLCVVYANVAAQGLLAMSFNQGRGRPFQDLFIDCNGLIATLKRAQNGAESISEREVPVRPVATPREPRVLDSSMGTSDGEVDCQESRSAKCSRSAGPPRSSCAMTSGSAP